MDANIDMYLCPCLLDLTRGVQMAAKISSAVYSWQQNPSLVTGGPQESKICILASLVSLACLCTIAKIAFLRALALLCSAVLMGVPLSQGKPDIRRLFYFHMYVLKGV